MRTEDLLDIEYRSHDRVQKLIDVVRFCVEDIRLSFDRWDEPYITGPGLYFTIIFGYTVRDHADPMEDNRWPVSECRDVLNNIDSFHEVISDVARSRNGAIVISVDGIVQEQMVRFRDYASTFDEDDGHTVEYINWMGSRHMKAPNTSARPEVIMAITLSAERGSCLVCSIVPDGEGLEPRFGC